MQLNQQHCNSQNNPHGQGERIHGDAKSRAGGSGGGRSGGGGGSGNGDIPASNIHLHDVSVITFSQENHFHTIMLYVASIPQAKGSVQD